MAASLDTIREQLLQSERVAITTHIRPDGDALGSQIALGLYLKSRGVEVHLINADPTPRYLEWLHDGTMEASVFDGSIRHRERITAADSVCVVDTGALHRLGSVGNEVTASRGKKILIDHHPEPETWFDLRHVDVKRASTGEIIFDLIKGDTTAEITTGIATALYTAIVTDTGSFRYGATTPNTHRIVAELLERGGISPEPIHVALYDSRRMSSLRLMGRALETITVHAGGRLATIHVTQRMVHSTDSSYDETEGLVNYALSIEGVEAAVIFLELPSGVKTSFRSKGDVPINGWAAKFGGGGHRNAAGAYLEGYSLKRALNDVVKSAPRSLRDDAQGTPGNNLGDHLSADDIALLEALKRS